MITVSLRTVLVRSVSFTTVMPHTLRMMNAASSALNCTATVLNISWVYLAASSALYPVAVMLSTFWVAVTTESALNRGNLLCFLGTCCLALVTLLMYYFLLAMLVVHAEVVTFFAFAAASRAGLMALPALWFLAMGTGRRVDLRWGSFVAVIRKSRTCC
ncbi:hypothetical protein VU02_00640 [Desulfobulbus sp. N2]|nr:hypothetical protein [Desulfobulbus sp. N2]